MVGSNGFHEIVAYMEVEHKLERRQNVPLAGYTSFRVGGPADELLVPQTTDALIELVCAADRYGVRRQILGNGTNVLFSDAGYRGAVILTTALHSIEIVGDEIRADCGVPLTALAASAANAGLTGLEFAYGIPGTLGGAVYMNAGAYGGEIAQVLTSSRWIAADGTLGCYEGTEHDFAYRHSVYQSSGQTVLSATLKLEAGDRSEITARMKDYMARRRDKQPLDYPSAGSTFKRYPGYYTGKLIEDSGLKGYSIGGAAVSEKHAGFVINKNRATASDIVRLIGHIRKVVYENYNIELECEVEVIPE